MRADRLLQLLLVLQNRGRSTTDRLAEELEVSRRTVIRDLFALRVAGFPINTERGPNGGVFLHRGFRLRLTDLTREELEALFALGVPHLMADVDMDATAKGALRKLAAALPLARTGVDRDVRNRIYLDPEPWTSRRSSNRWLAVVRQAVWKEVWCRVTFARIHSIPMENDIAVMGLVAKEGRWYIVWLDRIGSWHVDRGSRVVRAQLLEETFERPEGFDLVRFWTTWTPRYEAARPAFRVRAKIWKSSWEALSTRLHLPAMTSELTDARGWIDAELEFDSFEQARESLLSCGGAVRIDEPKALRWSVCDFAECTLEAYAQEGRFHRPSSQ